MTSKAIRDAKVWMLKPFLNSFFLSFIIRYDGASFLAIRFQSFDWHLLSFSFSFIPLRNVRALVYVSSRISSKSKWNYLKQQLSGVIVLIKFRIICPNKRLFIRLHDFSFSFFFCFNYSIMCVIEMLETKIKRRFAFRLGWNKTKQGGKREGEGGGKRERDIEKKPPRLFKHEIFVHYTSTSSLPYNTENEYKPNVIQSTCVWRSKK